MNRALRRHPTTAKQQQQRRPQRITPPSRQPRPQQRPPGRPAGRLRSLLRPRWLEDIISELKKVVWPTRQETAYLTMVVIVVATILGLILGGIDLGFSWIIEQTLLR